MRKICLLDILSLALRIDLLLRSTGVRGAIAFSMHPKCCFSSTPSLYPSQACRSNRNYLSTLIPGRKGGGGRGGGGRFGGGGASLLARQRSDQDVSDGKVPEVSSARGGALQVVRNVEHVRIGGNEVLMRRYLHNEPAKQVGSVGEADLTGLKIWPLAYPMLRHVKAQFLPALLDQPLQRSNQAPLKVLELGSGQGLFGIGLAALGAEVVLTDPAVEFGYSASTASNTLDRLRENIELNTNLVCGRATAQKLLWGHETDIANVGKRGPFDLIIGCEIIYNSESHAALIATLKRCSSNSRTVIVLGFLERNAGESEFLDLARMHFDVSLEPMDLGSESVATTMGGMQARLAVCRPL